MRGKSDFPTCTSLDSIFIMNKVLGILLIGLTAVLFNSHLIASVSVEEAIQKRIEMFKSSKANIKKLKRLIRSGDTNEAVPLAEFHLAWSKEMPMLFPLGS